MFHLYLVLIFHLLVLIFHFYLVTIFHLIDPPSIILPSQTLFLSPHRSSLGKS